jgi:1-acyl-sn-glycerol-3-phosphate acyltransferase
VRKIEPWFTFAEAVLRPPAAFWFNWRFEGLENIPAEGPLLVACNHVSYLDPIAHALLMLKAHRRPRFLAKSGLYKNWFTRTVLTGAGQIRVDRGSGSHGPVDAAVAGLKCGEAVMIYPEATITTNADFTPMTGKTGIARIALRADVPVLPIATWGGQYVWQRDGAHNLSFGRPIWLRAGTPLDFSEFERRQEDPAALRTVTDAVMDELTRLVNELRSAYPKRWQ